MAAHLSPKRLARLIPVDPQPEPEDFEVKVRKPGTDWLAANGIAAQSPLPKGTTLRPYWTEALEELGAAYSYVCSYFAVRIDIVTATSRRIISSRSRSGRSVPTSGATSV